MSKLPPPSPTHTHTRARARTFFLIVAWCALKLFQRKIKLKDATFYIPDDITAYNDYTNFISEANLAISGRDLLLNVHGQAPTPQRTELGYLISKSQLVDRSYKIASTSTRSILFLWGILKNFVNKNGYGKRCFDFWLHRRGIHIFSYRVRFYQLFWRTFRLSNAFNFRTLICPRRWPFLSDHYGFLLTRLNFQERLIFAIKDNSRCGDWPVRFAIIIK